MFWGMALKSGKRYTKTLDYPIHISSAVLDTNYTDDDEIVRVVVEYDDLDAEIIIANLSLKHGILHSPLDLDFDSGSQVSFYTDGGTAPVHLSGYLVYDLKNFNKIQDAEESEDDEQEEEEEEEEEEVEDEEEVPVPAKGPAAKRKITEMAESVSKKNKVDFAGLKRAMEFPEDETDDTDSDEEVLPKTTEPKTLHKKEAKVGKPLKHETVLPNKAPKKDKPPKQDKGTPVNKRPKQELGAQTNKVPKKDKGAPVKTPDQVKGSDVNKTPKQDGNAINGKTPKIKEKCGKPLENTPNTPGGAQTASKSPKAVLTGGVTREDVIEGAGKEAKLGHMVSVFYTGRLMSNKKVFDRCENGKGFKFRLGKGEVIKGWDIGVPGMKVGGVRKIICPPHMAYGKTGAPPDIPPQATLMFTVELKSTW